MAFFRELARSIPVLVLCLCSAFADAAAPAKRDNAYGRTLREVTLPSKQGRRYRLLVSVPKAAPPQDGYPVFYVLDGNAWFGTAVEIVRMREYEKLAPAIVVGIASGDRSFFDDARALDFTPKGSHDADFAGIETGGAETFLAFLGDSVQPWVRARYRVDPHRRILFGHSLGGLFALHALFTAPQSFDVYIAASPHVRFSDSAVIKEADALKIDERMLGARLLVTDGTLERHESPALVEDYRRWYTAHPEAIPGMSVDDAINETFSGDVDAFDKLAATRALVERLAHNGLRASYAEFEGEEHMSAAICA